jgi:hypothetical protein
MKSVLWISRHNFTPAQYADLERICGEKLEVQHHAANVEDLNDLRTEIAAADVICAVLPIHLLAELRQMAGDDKPVLIAQAVRTLIPATDGGEPRVVFAHGGWQRVTRLELVLDTL